MPELTTDIRYVKGVGEKRANDLSRLGIQTLGDLLRFYPRTYEDRTLIRPIAEVGEGESACICAMVAGLPRLARIRGGAQMVRFRAVDDSGSVEITYFNQTYMRDRFIPGESYIFYGRMGGTEGRKTLANPEAERADARSGEVAGAILPVYPLTRGITNKLLRRMIRGAIEECGAILPELLPEEIRLRQGLCPADYAVRNVHFPSDFAALALAQKRLAFEEAFTFSCALALLRGKREKSPGIVLRDTELSAFYAALPFSPTAAQKRAIDDIVRDTASGGAMSRLVQGDVGSGKTLVAAAGIYLAVKNGLQAAFMAPTELLAAQHFQTLTGFLAPLGIRVGLLTGSMKAAERREVLEKLPKEEDPSGKARRVREEVDVLIGTHALFTDQLSFPRLGLVIVDEQHRFGVEQRAALSAKGERAHMLVMSATPIPRTLALILYGDLDVSIIDELPPGRQSVDTFAVGESYRARLNGFIRKQVSEGHQVFVVCPMVEENEDIPMELTSATEHAERLRKEFPELTVGCVHGKLKPKDKDAAMAAFAGGETDILVATTVVEVGVDVPNATLMVVENAERFGLSQLHQLRGRVGRGRAKSYCVLVSDAKGEDARARLKILCATNDGFRVAEEDLRLRGPGDFFGSRQSGQELHLSAFCADMDVLSRAQSEAQELISRDPALAGCPALREQLDRLFTLREGTIN